MLCPCSYAFIAHMDYASAHVTYRRDYSMVPENGFPLEHADPAALARLALEQHASTNTGGGGDSSATATESALVVVPAGVVTAHVTLPSAAGGNGSGGSVKSNKVVPYDPSTSSSATLATVPLPTGASTGSASGAAATMSSAVGGSSQKLALLRTLTGLKAGADGGHGLSTETKKDLIGALADHALASFVLINCGLKRSGRLARYCARPDLNARMPGFQVGMGFGLHVGWAIEGAIGEFICACALGDFFGCMCMCMMTMIPSPRCVHS